MPASIRAHARPARPKPARRNPRGFTLIELITVVIILGVVAVVALPKYISLGRNARLASLQSMTGTLWAAANNVHALCGLTPQCDYGNQVQFITMAGEVAGLNYGWPEAGDYINGAEIDRWVTYAGFSVSLPNSGMHQFSLDGAPDPANCAVRYEQAYGAQLVPLITSLTSGC